MYFLENGELIREKNIADFMFLSFICFTWENGGDARLLKIIKPITLSVPQCDIVHLKNKNKNIDQ